MIKPSGGISSKLGWLLALLLLGGYLLLPYLSDLALRASGLPALEEDALDVSDPENVRLLPLNDLRYVAGALLHDARSEEPGVWIPEVARAEAVEASLAAYGQTFLWLSDHREVLYRSEGLEYEVGEVIPNLNLADKATAARPYSDVALGRIVTAVFVGGEKAGWLVIHGEPPFGAHLPDEGVYLDTQVRTLTGGIVTVATFLIVVVLAIALAFASSRLVTGRVSALAREASAPIDDPRKLPGPFPDEGEDEIAVLGGALNRMRGKVQELVGDLDRQDQERRRWIAQVSHDLRTPLTALSACLTRAEDDARNGRDVTERLEVAQHDARRLAELVEDLLDVARLEAGEEAVLEPVPPGEISRAAVRGLEALAETDGITLTLELATGLPLLEADGRRLMRALENLLKNALHHAEARVTLLVTGDGNHVRFSVEDDGPGLPAGESGEVNVEALAAHLSRPDSAGLGLVVVRKVAEMHAGTMGAENRDEGGARVWIELPASEEELL